MRPHNGSGFTLRYLNGLLCGSARERPTPGQSGVPECFRAACEAAAATATGAPGWAAAGDRAHPEAWPSREGEALRPPDGRTRARAGAETGADQLGALRPVSGASLRAPGRPPGLASFCRVCCLGRGEAGGGGRISLTTREGAPWQPLGQPQAALSPTPSWFSSVHQGKFNIE